MKEKKRKSKTKSYLSTQFEKERLKILNKAVATGAILAAILVPFFSLLDLVFKFHMFWTFFEIRIAVVLISIAVLFLIKTPFGKKYPYPLGGFLTVVVGGSIALMCYLDQGPVDPYYAGINLPLLGFGILLPLSIGEGIIVFALVWISYFVPNLLRLHHNEIGTFVSNNFFMVSTILIALVSSQFHLYYRRKEWYTRHRLESAHRKIKNHAKELEEKVTERTKKLLQTERLAVIGELAGGIAHDFNNILTAILGASGILLSSLPKKDPLRNEVESISRVGKRGARLVKQLLAFSRKQILLPKTLNINDVIKDVGKMLRRLIKEDIELVIDLSPDLARVQADPVQIEQIILNLSLNARDAMPDGGKLIIKTENVVLDKAYCKVGKVTLSPGQYVMLLVSDTGIGMTEEIKAKIFEPFFTTKEKGEGTGLGLSSVYGIVKQSKGDIVVYTEKGKGTTFKIYFPRVEQSTENTYNESEKMFSEKPIRGKETILLVEDEDDVRTLTARVLEKQGYKVMQAREGNDALALAEWYKGKIDLLLTDVSMPYMNGKSLAERLKEKRSEIKVLFMSGHADRRVIPPGIINSDVAFLPKPYTAEVLCNKIRSVIDKN